MKDLIFSEDFETDGNGTRYATADANGAIAEFSDGSGDFFTRTDGTDIGSFYNVTGFGGASYFAAMDLDGEGATLPLTLSFSGIDISGLTGLSFSVDLAEDDDGSNEDWDTSDSVLFEYSIDGGAFQKLIAVESIPDGDNSNAVPAIDTDFDGNGDGPQITSAFATFTADIAGAGNALDLRVTYSLNSGDEDLSIDNLKIEAGDGDPVAPQIVISEVMFNPQSGENDWEWTEIVNTGTGTVDLSGWVLDDSNATALNAANIAAGTVAPGQSAILYNADKLSAADFEAAWGAGINLIAVTGWSSLNNSGSEAVGLWSSFGDYSGDNQTQANAVVSATLPTSLDDGAASVYLTDLTDQTSWALSTDGGATPAGAGYVSAAGGGNSGADVASPGGTLPPPPSTVTLISEIQGTPTTQTTEFGRTDASPLFGTVVTVEAIVVGDFQDGGLGENGDFNGFYLQEEDADADGDATSSEGIFVFDGFDPTVDVQIGDKVQVTGTVAEFFGETQIQADSITVISSDNSAPTAATITFPVASTTTNSDGELIADLEAYEGMLVMVPQELTVSDLFTFGRFGDIGLHADGRLEQFTQANAPSLSGFQAYQDLAVRNSLTLDDGSTSQNPTAIPFEIPTEGGNIPGQFDAADDLNVGDTVEGLTGVLRYGRGSGSSGDEIYRLNPIDTVPFENTNPRETVAPDVGGDLTVATFNVLNFFTTLDDERGRNDNPQNAGPDGSEPRGANDFNFDGNGLEPGDVGYVPDLTEFNRQLDKLMAAFQGMDADIYGLVEVENEIGDQNGDEEFALGFLATELNARFGTNYQIADPGTPYVGGDAIMVGFIYDADTVKIADDTTVAVLTDADLAGLGVDPGNPVFDGPGTSRAPVAATFEELTTGEEITVTVNHFKSKGSVSPFGDNEGIDDGAGNNNEARLQAAQALDAWLATNPTGSQDEDILILGDLNAYALEDPIQYLLDEGYFDPIQASLGPDEISYSFGFPISLDSSPQVQAFGSLDYALASQSLSGQITGAKKWHINADEASVLDYNIEFRPQEQIDDLYAASPYRSSDHDPLVVGLDLTTEPDVFTLELLHIADQEAGAAATRDADNLSAVLNALRAQDLGDDGQPDNTITLSSGDAFIPGVFYDASEAVFGAGGIADIQIQNELGIQAIALGNHEFDFGTRDLAELISGIRTEINDNGTPDDDSDDFPEQFALGDFTAQELDGTALEDLDFTGTDMPYLSANLDFSTDPNLAPLESTGGQAPQGNAVTSSTLVDVNGAPIGVIGATTPTLASISSPGSVGISPTWASGNPTDAELDALAAEIQAEVDALLAANPELNKIILLSHMQQFGIELSLAERLTDVDVIVAGGSNTRLFDDNDRPRDGDSDQGEYPQFVTDADGNATAVVNTDGSYKYVGRLAIDFDANGNIIPASYDEDVSGAYATDDQGVADLNAAGLVDAEIDAITDAIENQIIATESNVFGVSDVFLNGNRSGTGAADDPDGVRTQETNLGNLTADANLAEAQKSDSEIVISLKNGGGIRANIGETIVPAGGTEPVRSANGELIDSQDNIIKPAGGISQTDIQTTLAFNNDLVVLTLTRAEIIDLLEHGVSALPGVSGRFPQISGLEFSFDADAPSGDRIQSAQIVDEDGNMIAPLVFEGELVGDPAATFKVVTLGFLAASRFDDDGNFTGGGDGYPFPNLNTDPVRGEVGDPDVIARVNFTALEQEGVQGGAATFADDGTEQDALAEYLNDNFNPETGGAVFAEADAGPDSDARIQNLDFRSDDVFEFDELFVGDGSRVQRFEMTDGVDEIFVADDLSDGARQRFIVEGFEAGVDQVSFDQEDILFSREAGPNLLVYLDNADRDSFTFLGLDSEADLFGPSDLPLT